MARFRYNACSFAVYMVAFFSVVLACRAHLAHKCVTPLPGPKNFPLIMLHGLTDTKETWNGIYQPVSFLTDRRVCIFDARNHGDSGWNDTFNVDVLAEDLGYFIEDKKIEGASLVGHSMGGLTVMKFALRNPEKIESIFVEDIAPNSITQEIGEMITKSSRIMLDSLSAIPENADAETAEKAVAEYLAKKTDMPFPEHVFRRFPLRCEGGVWQWKENYEAFIKAFEEEGYFLGKLEGQYNGRAFFIYGTASPFKVNENEEDIRKLFPKAEFFGMEGANHNVHPNATVYIRKLVQFLSEVSQNNVHV